MGFFKSIFKPITSIIGDIGGAFIGSRGAGKGISVLSKAVEKALKEISDAIDRAGGYLDQATAEAIAKYLAGAHIASSMYGQYSKEAIAAQREAISKIMQLASPYLKTGKEALNLQKKIAFSLKTSPLYQWQKEEGTRAINRQLAARGLYNSRAGLETLRRFYTNLGATETEKQYQRIKDLTTLGAGMTQWTGNKIAGLYGNIGNIYSGTGTNLGNLYADIYSNIGRSLYNTGVNRADLLLKGIMARTGLMTDLATSRANASASRGGMWGNVLESIMKTLPATLPAIL